MSLTVHHPGNGRLRDTVLGGKISSFKCLFGLLDSRSVDAARSVDPVFSIDNDAALNNNGSSHEIWIPQNGECPAGSPDNQLTLRFAVGPPENMFYTTCVQTGVCYDLLEWQNDKVWAFYPSDDLYCETYE